MHVRVCEHTPRASPEIPASPLLVLPSPPFVQDTLEAQVIEAGFVKDDESKISSGLIKVFVLRQPARVDFREIAIERCQICVCLG